jgi:hypothetical protein
MWLALLRSPTYRGICLPTYLLCLERALSLFAILGEEHLIGWDMIPVFNLGDTSLNRAAERAFEVTR